MEEQWNHKERQWKAACLANLPTDVFEVVHRLPVLHELPELELIGTAERGRARARAAGAGGGGKHGRRCRGGGSRA